MTHRWRDVDDVAIDQLSIRGVATLCQKAVQIKLCHDLSGSFELHMTHRAVGIGTTCCKQAARQGGDAAEGVAARAARLTHHVHGDGAQLTQSHTQLKTFVIFTHSVLEHALCLASLNAS